jgi:hypothetical protein
MPTSGCVQLDLMCEPRGATADGGLDVHKFPSQLSVVSCSVGDWVGEIRGHLSGHQSVATLFD